MNGGYRCVHVPLTHARSGGAMKGALIVAAVAVVAWKVFGPWVILTPLLVLAALVALVVTIRVRKARGAAVRGR